MPVPRRLRSHPQNLLSLARAKGFAAGIVNGQDLITATRGLDRLIESLEDMAQGKGSKYALMPLSADAAAEA